MANQEIKLVGKDLIKSEMAKQKQLIEKLIPKHIDAGQLMTVVWAAIQQVPKLADCTPVSIIRATVQSAMLGLVPNDGRGLAYIIPYGTVATFVAGYKGLEALAYQSADVRSIRAREVYEGDGWEYDDGLDLVLRHRPSDRAAFDERGKEIRPLIAAYCIASIRGEKLAEVMQRWEIDRIRERSMAKNNGPWVTDFGMMARKTAIRRASKYWPVATERMTPLGRAIQLDEEADRGAPQSLDQFILEAFPDPEAPAKTTGELAARRAASANGGSASAPVDAKPDADRVHLDAIAAASDVEAVQAARDYGIEQGGHRGTLEAAAKNRIEQLAVKA